MSERREGVGMAMAGGIKWAGLGLRNEWDLSKCILNIDSF